MANIVILGAGVMGSALAIPAASIGSNNITLVGSPLDDELIKSVQNNRHHPTLDTSIDKRINAVQLSDLDKQAMRNADLIVIGVSNAGVDWAIRLLLDMQVRPDILALVTKGLVKSEGHSAPLTYADVLAEATQVSDDNIVGIGGPCIARELALGYPTRVTFACRNIENARAMRNFFQTDYYRITVSEDMVALEACAALKNFLCIGVSAMLSKYPLDNAHAKNPLAALFNQAVRELFILSQWICMASTQNRENTKAYTEAYSSHVAFDLAGMGDLHVTVGGGRNSRLGAYLGRGETLSHVQSTCMAGVTVEGVDTGRNLLGGFRAACDRGVLQAAQLPLTDAILNCIEFDERFAFDFMQLPE